MLAGALAGLGDGRLEDRIDALGGHKDACAGLLVAVLHGAGAIEQAIQPGEGRFEGGLGQLGRADLVEGFGFVIKAEAVALQAGQVGRHGSELPEQVVPAQSLIGLRRRSRDAGQNPRSLGLQLGKGTRSPGLRGGLPDLRPVIGVHKIRIVASHRQHQVHVVRGPLRKRHLRPASLCLECTRFGARIAHSPRSTSMGFALSTRKFPATPTTSVRAADATIRRRPRPMPGWVGNSSTRLV